MLQLPGKVLLPPYRSDSDRYQYRYAPRTREALSVRKVELQRRRVQNNREQRPRSGTRRIPVDGDHFQFTSIRQDPHGSVVRRIVDSSESRTYRGPLSEQVKFNIQYVYMLYVYTYIIVVNVASYPKWKLLNT